MKKIRYFFDFIDTQAKWLNKMAGDGFRLVSCRTLTYTFERCSPGEFEYAVEFIADKSCAKANEYKQLLQGFGYRTFEKNINVNFSVGKARWRPWGKGAGQFATAPGTYNHELLIIEKRRGSEPLELHTNMQDMSLCCQTISFSYLRPALLIFAFGIAGMFTLISLPLWSVVILSIIGVALMCSAIKYFSLASKYRKESKIID